MRRSTFTLGAIAALSLLLASAVAAKPGQEPEWVSAATQQVIRSEQAQPVLITFIPYPKKFAVVIEFNRVVKCQCSGPTDKDVPHGRVIRVSFDRRTHARNAEVRFCEVSGVTPPLAACLAR
jgi:hypothetical protein